MALILRAVIEGRKHQLRMHVAFALGSPVVGDSLYGSNIPAREWARPSGRDRSPFLRQLRSGLQLHCRTLQVGKLSSIIFCRF